MRGAGLALAALLAAMLPGAAADARGNRKRWLAGVA